MIIVAHRINRLEELNALPTRYGVEVDVRAEGTELLLHHDPFQGGESLESYLESYRHRLIIFNIKEAGIEESVIAMARKYGIADFFLLDVEFPYLYRAARAGIRDIAVRYSEDEPIETATRYRDMVNWVWIDTQTRLPLDAQTVETLGGTRSCLVSPDRWGRPEDIPRYREQMEKLSFTPAAVMTGKEYIPLWEA